MGFTDRYDRISVKNGSGSTVPAFGLVVSSGNPDKFGILPVTQVSVDSDPSVMVVGENQLLAGETGWATFDPRVIVAYDTGDGTPAVGESWGPAAGSFKLRKGKSGFTILGGADSTVGLVNAVRTPDSSCCLWGAGWVADQLPDYAGSGFAVGFSNGGRGVPAPQVGGISWANTGLSLSKLITDSLVVIPKGSGYVNVRGQCGGGFVQAQALPISNHDSFGGWSAAAVRIDVVQVNASNQDTGDAPIWTGHVCSGQYMTPPEYLRGHVAVGIPPVWWVTGDVISFDSGLYSTFAKEREIEFDVWVGAAADLRLMCRVTLTKSINNWDLQWSAFGWLRFKEECCDPVHLDFPGSQGNPLPAMNGAAMNTVAMG